MGRKVRISDYRTYSCNQTVLLFNLGSRTRRPTAQERRVSGFLERPGVRDILANRVREARVMENREEQKRRARVERVEPHVASVVR